MKWDGQSERQTQVKVDTISEVGEREGKSEKSRG